MNEILAITSNFSLQSRTANILLKSCFRSSFVITDEGLLEPENFIK